mgnify:CR=1 FL=1
MCARGMRVRTRRWLRVAAVVMAGGAALAWFATPYVKALAFIIDVSGRDVPGRRWLPVQVRPVDAETIAVATRHGAIEGRLYRPMGMTGGASRTVLVVPGLHAAGVEEPRLDRLSRRLAGEGITVLSLPLPDLRKFLVTPRSTDMIEDAALWLANQPAITPGGQIGLIGISFGGGLALVAAGRPSLANRLDRVVTFGAHGDLPRVIRYVCTGLLPDGAPQPAHDYGAVLVLIAALPHLVPPEQVAPLDRAVRVFLDASMVDVSEPARAAALFRDARDLGAALPEPARSVMADVSARDATRLGPRLVDLAERVGGHPALSPERSPAAHARVFLVHGAVDTVIPQTETPAVAAFLKRSGASEVNWLLTPTVSHADATASVTASDVWALVRFWKQIFT